MNLKVGDRVSIDNKEAVVTGNWGAGKHMIWKLDDGREVPDLHLLVAKGSVLVIPQKTQTYGDMFNKKGFPRLPREEEDLEH